MANSPSGESMADRIVRVLETFTATRTAQTIAEIGRRAGLPRSTAHRVVSELVAVGLLDRDEQQRVRIGIRLWELSTRSSWALRLRQAAMPFMEQVQAQVREHTQLAILEQGEALFVERLSDPHAGANITRIAGRLPLHASSSGLVLLAFGPVELHERVFAEPLARLSASTIVDPEALRRKLAEVRALGYAVAPGFVADVSTGLAVPVRDEVGTVVAALSVVLPRHADPDAALMPLRRAADGITRALSERTRFTSR